MLLCQSSLLDHKIFFIQLHLHVLSTSTVIVPFKNRFNAVLWGCLHRLTNVQRSKVPLTTAVTLTLRVNETFRTPGCQVPIFSYFSQHTPIFPIFLAISSYFSYFLAILLFLLIFSFCPFSSSLLFKNIASV